MLGIFFGTLTFAGNEQPEVSGTVHLPAGEITVWYAVRCDDCGETNDDRSNFIRYPKHIQITVSGPSDVAVQHYPLAQAASSGDHFGYGEQKQMARLHVTKAGAYTVHVTVKPYSLPQRRLYNPDRRILLGPYLPGTPLLDQNRLLLLAVLLALSVLIMLRPRRRPAVEPGPGAPPA